jgi:hypothetical protein
VTTTLSLTTTEEPVVAAHRVVVTVPTRWWEVTALRAPDVDSERLMVARACLLGDPFVRTEPAFRVSGSNTIITVENPRLFLGTAATRCLGVLGVKLEYRALRAGTNQYARCEDGTVMTDPDTVHLARIETPDRDRVRLRPAPAREADRWFQWTWTGKGAPNLAVEVPLDFASYASTSMSNDASLDVDPLGDELVLRLGGLGSWGPTFIVIVLAVTALAFSGAISWWAMLAAAAATLFLTAGAALSWRPATGVWTFVATVVPLFAVGGATVAAALLRGGRLVGRWRSLAVASASALVGGALVALALAEALRDRPTVDARADVLAGVILAGSLVLVALLLGRVLAALLSTLRQESPGEKGFPWRIARRVVAGSVAGAFVFGVGWYLGYLRETRSPLDVLSRTASSLPFHTLAYAAAAVAGVGFLSLIRVWSDRSEQLTRRLVALGLVWALVAAPADLWLWGIYAPVGALLLAVALPLAVRRFGTVERRRSGGVDEADLEDRETVREVLVHGPEGTWRGNLRATVELGAFLSLIPVAYFLWALLQAVPERSTDPLGVAFLVGNTVMEAARWMSTAAVFGLLYPRLWGYIGPLKALSLSAVWFGAAAAGEVAARWTDHGSGRVWSFPGFQLLLFTGVLAVAYDLRTLHRRGLGWRQLQRAYGIERTRDLVAVAVPITLAVVAIAQQLATGTGLDFVQQIVDNIPRVLPAGR